MGSSRRSPRRSPPGSEDIYGLDISIAWGSEDLMWQNGGPSGCGGGTSSVQATDEDKAQVQAGGGDCRETGGRDGLTDLEAPEAKFLGI